MEVVEDEATGQTVYAGDGRRRRSDERRRENQRECAGKVIIAMVQAWVTQIMSDRERERVTITWVNNR